MIKFLPAPGFMGRMLSDDELESTGLDRGRFALKVTHLNQSTYLAGIRMGDIILRAGDRSDFPTPRDFYHWCEIMRRSGRDIKMELVRQDALMNVMVSQETLNDSRVAQAPRVQLGFIVQELPADAGLRVGHVTDHSSAEKTGLLIGDRIVSVDGQAVATRENLDQLLHQKAPGDLLIIQVTRAGERMSFSYVLPGEQELKSDLARLSGAVSQPGQELACIVTIKLPPDRHIYSVHREGFGLPTQLEFRGHGYELSGPVQEPPPRKVEDPGVEPMWILEGTVELRQLIRITDPQRFQLLLHVYAQVCDNKSCHEFRSVIVSDGRDPSFKEFHGRFDQSLPIATRVGIQGF
jgi:hypothetical protein